MHSSENAEGNNEYASASSCDRLLDELSDAIECF
jgi:hypothetical protein